MSTFIANYVSNPTDVPTVQKTINLFKKYLKNGVSYKILNNDTDDITIDTQDDKDTLIASLQYRLVALQEQQPYTVKNETDVKHKNNIQILVQYFEKAPIGPKKFDRVDEKDLVPMLTRMTLYLTHPDTVPAEIHDKWIDIINSLNAVNFNDVVIAINKLIEAKSIANGETADSIQKQIEQLVKIMHAIEDEEEDEETLKKQATAVAIASQTLAESVTSSVTAPAAPVAIGGGHSLTTRLASVVITPAIEEITAMYPMYSVIEDYSYDASYDLVVPLQKLLRICTTIADNTHFGFYRIVNAPKKLFTYIQYYIQHAIDHASFNESKYSNSYNNTYRDSNTYQYFLCLDGNLSYTTTHLTSSQEKLERSAVKKFFQSNTIYLLYTDKKRLDMSYYMDDSYYAYDIDYNMIDDTHNKLRIKNANTILNTEPIQLDQYLDIDSQGVFDKHHLDLSVFLQLKHLLQL